MTKRETEAMERLVLNEDLSGAPLEELRVALLSILESGTRTEIDGSKVRKAGAQPLQILLGFVRQQRNRLVVVEWVAVSEQLREATKLLGLETEIGMTEAR